MSFDAKSEILSAIARTDDPNMKTVLLLLLGVLESTSDKIDGVADTLKAIWKDEQALRVTVLNGHEPVHHSHHEWVAKKIKEETNAEEDARKVKVGVIEKVLGYLIVAALAAFCTWLGLR